MLQVYGAPDESHAVARLEFRFPVFLGYRTGKLAPVTTITDTAWRNSDNRYMPRGEALTKCLARNFHPN